VHIAALSKREHHNNSISVCLWVFITTSPQPAIVYSAPPCPSRITHPQVVVQILVFVMFFLLLCGTYLFRVGLIGVLSKYFKGVMAVTLIYLILTGITGGLRLAFIGGGMPFQKLWDYGGFTTMSIVHKLFATFYYIVNIRTALQIGDPKFYTKVCHISSFLVVCVSCFLQNGFAGGQKRLISFFLLFFSLCFDLCVCVSLMFCIFCSPQEPWVQMYREGNK
jgi:hypothetical protein